MHVKRLKAFSWGCILLANTVLFTVALLTTNYIAAVLAVVGFLGVVPTYFAAKKAVSQGRTRELGR